MNKGTETQESNEMKRKKMKQESTTKEHPDKDAKKAKKKAQDDNVCIPIGEGENCW